jgi:hypothetical protein
MHVYAAGWEKVTRLAINFWVWSASIANIFGFTH